MTLAIAATFTLLATLTLFPNNPRPLHRLTARPSRPPRRKLLYLTLVLLVALSILIAFGPYALATTTALSAALLTTLSHRKKSIQSSKATRKQSQIIEACDLLAADLTAGRPPQEALTAAADSCPDLRPAAAAARLGGDVPATLHLAAETPGAESLKPLAAAWQVADHSGAALATILTRLTTTLRANQALHHQRQTNTSAAKSTARLLAILPIATTLLGQSFGATPITFLTTTLPGTLCLLTGTALALAGLHWTNHLTKSP
ncbi:type II secretion system F family protein [Kribbella sp. NPDC051770]|uniref:type II secretion system F family protein n=1 Tax=Kribbella sp. NPDC051770 TaxID=3155413 RepID=UPI0034481E59